jgi:hypothetical protein
MRHGPDSARSTAAHVALSTSGYAYPRAWRFS